MDENLIDQALSELGLLEVGMTFQEKKELLQAIEISKSTAGDELQTQNVQYNPKLWEDQTPDKTLEEKLENTSLESTLEESHEDDEPLTDQNKSVEIISSTQNNKEEKLENKSDKLRIINGKNGSSKIVKNKNKNKFIATQLKGKYKSEESLRTCPKCDEKLTLFELVKHIKICRAIPTNFSRSSIIPTMFNSSSSSSQTSSSNSDPDVKFSTFVPISQQMDSCIDYHNQFKYGELKQRPKKIRKTRKKRRTRKR